jgi:hypothetical protein
MTFTGVSPVYSCTVSGAALMRRRRTICWTRRIMESFLELPVEEK